MYPGSQFNWIDNSAIPPVVTESIVKPLFLTAISSNKGPEELMVVQGENFYKLFGTDISFAKHGQPLLQADAIIRAGGRLLVKRLVADDALLANIIIVAKVSKVSKQKTNSQGQLLFTDSVTGLETVEAEDNTPIMVTSANIKYEAQAANDCKSFLTTISLAEGLLDDTGTGTAPDLTYTYPLFVVTDNGRGASTKKVKIVPDYGTSRSRDYVVYSFIDLENTTVMESVHFTADPDIVYENVNMSLTSVTKSNVNQVKANSIDESIELFIKRLASISGLEADVLRAEDFLFGKNKKGAPLGVIEVDPSGLSLDHVYGLVLTEGSNGEFGNTPFGTEAYSDQAVKFFDGTFTKDIYDLDRYKIDMVVDANYPAEVKRAIENLITYREDAFYFRDLGLNLTTLEGLVAADAASTKNKFCGSYLTTYDVIDPYSKKQINVTMMYTLARLLVSHFSNGRSVPLAGQIHNMILTDAIKDTINFVPIITPDVNQKTLLEDARINYASYQDEMLVIETLYTSQEKHTQFSYVNNVLAVQEVVKAVRTFCPKVRYQFIDEGGADFKKYQEDVQAVINKFTPNFKELRFVYVQDPVMVANKIFQASLACTFKNFVQSEIFKIEALG